MIKKSRKLKKTSVRGSIGFDHTDFTEFADGGDVQTLTVLTLPDVSAGVLKVGALDVFAGQRLSASLIGLMRFIPAYAGAEAEFSFSVNGDTDAAQCLLCSLKKENSAPQAEPVKVYTKQNVTSYAKIEVSDPDGDATECCVISQPSHGTLRISDDGAFSYKPDRGYLGSDSFVCVFEDKYGEKSEPVTAKIKVERNKSGVVYSDMAGSEAEYAAYLLAEKDILVGQTVGGASNFEPEKPVSRADFIVMAMKAAGYAPNVYSPLRGGFADAAYLTDQQRGYVITAMSAGVIEAEERDGALMLRPTSDITVSEAADIVASLTGKETGAGPENGGAPLSRADAAVMLAAVIDAGR